MSKRPALIPLVVVALTLLAVLVYVRHEVATSQHKICNTMLSARSFQGGTVALEDQGGPGRDGCDDRHAGASFSWNVLGFDCKIRDPGDVVVATSTPNRADGTCGQ
jgi:hypothetical protein